MVHQMNIFPNGFQIHGDQPECTIEECPETKKLYKTKCADMYVLVHVSCILYTFQIQNENVHVVRR